MVTSYMHIGLTYIVGGKTVARHLKTWAQKPQYAAVKIKIFVIQSRPIRLLFRLYCSVKSLFTFSCICTKYGLFSIFYFAIKSRETCLSGTYKVISPSLRDTDREVFSSFSN